MFTDDLTTILIDAQVVTGNNDIFIGSKVTLPDGDGPFLVIIETGGAAPEGTHNSTDAPAYVRPSAQIVVHGMNYGEARAMSQAAFNALFKIRNQKVNGTFWRSILMVQEPFDLRVDDKTRPRIAFNINCVKRLSSATS